jgi:hypothetical protein
VLWSAAAGQSSSLARKEVAIKAWARDRLVLVRVDDADLPPGLRDIAAVDLGSDYEQRIAEIVRKVTTAAEISVPTPAKSLRRRTALAGILLGLAFIIGTSSYVLLNKWQPPQQQLSFGARPDISISKERAESPAHPAAGKSGGCPGWPFSTLPCTVQFPVLTMVVIGGTLSGSLMIWVMIWIAKRHRHRTAMPPIPQLSSATPPLQSPSSSLPHEVFVSYSRHDERLVDRLVGEIESCGRRVWIDRRAGTPGMQRYAAPIVAAIRSSRLVALMCSGNAFASDHVIREVYVAGELKKSFIAFELDDTKIPDELLYFLSGFPRVPSEPIDPSLIRFEIARLLG